MAKNDLKILFLHEYQNIVKDGLFEALNELEKYYQVDRINVNDTNQIPSGYNFYLGHGAFNSAVDRKLSSLNVRKGLLIGGNSFPPDTADLYDVLFCETQWIKDNYLSYTNTRRIKAFGVNTKIYKPMKMPKVIDYLTVGSFSSWKRQELLANKPGVKVAIGYIQRSNDTSYLSIPGLLLSNGIGVMDIIDSEVLAKFYNMSKHVYIPARIDGGGERAILEARACGIPVEVESDNPKLKELCYCPIYDYKYYAKQIKKGIDEIFNLC